MGAVQAAAEGARSSDRAWRRARPQHAARPRRRSPRGPARRGTPCPPSCHTAAPAPGTAAPQAPQRKHQHRDGGFVCDGGFPRSAKPSGARGVFRKYHATVPTPSLAARAHSPVQSSGNSLDCTACDAHRAVRYATNYRNSHATRRTPNHAPSPVPPVPPAAMRTDVRDHGPRLRGLARGGGGVVVRAVAQQEHAQVTAQYWVHVGLVEAAPGCGVAPGIPVGLPTPQPLLRPRVCVSRQTSCGRGATRCLLATGWARVQDTSRCPVSPRYSRGRSTHNPGF